MMELPTDARFQPKEPRTWEEAGIDPLFAETLILRYLLVAVSDSGRNIAQETALAVPLVKELLDQLKQNKLVVHRSSTAMGDFIFELTDMGRAKAVESRRATWYVGPAPVPFAAFCQAVKEQSLSHRRLTVEDLHRAFEDLSVSERLLERLGPAIHSGKAMFLHGDPGNGKTSLAERITRCFGDTIWVPQTLLIDGHVVKLFDPATHEMVDPNFKPLTPQEKLDRRWVKIKRPTVVAGGELTMEMLEIQVNVVTNVHEAPLQIKAACGTLVIDDFGRQRMPAQELLNRWIFPLERRIDFLKLPDGRKISSPFDLLLVFSTNLEPRDLVDEAFLRRIPYKIHVENPSEEEFRNLIEIIARKADVQVVPGSVSYLLERHYKKTGRPLRFCHPRDLLLQILHACEFEQRPRIAGPADWDRAASNYFGMI
jgi:predicted ATPase with chaperone activity